MTHRLYRGWIRDNGDNIDDVLLTFMKKPKSYTGEDMIEINAHGGPGIMSAILRLVLKSGARLAEPGEFSKRAFLNGKIDLNQAESIAWLISASSESEIKSAARQLKGELSKLLVMVKKEIIELLALMELYLDFDEYEKEYPPYEEFYKRLQRIKIKINRIYIRAGKGQIMSNGLNVVIVGKPNVGKSSLLNTFLQQKRAIVSSKPGTTRDTIEEVIKLNEIPLRIIDTAGIKQPSQEIERESLKRAKKKIEEADLILVVIDSGTDISEEDIQTLHMIRNKHALIVINKTDIPKTVDLNRIRSELTRRKVVRISARRNWGLPRLKAEISAIIQKEFIKSETDSIMISQKRRMVLQEALAAIRRASINIKKKISVEFIVIDIKEILNKLKIMLGEEAGNEILEEIFSNFCLGK